MPLFQFFQNAKHSIIYRSNFNVEADTYEQAVEKVKEYRNRDIFDDDIPEFGKGCCEIIWETGVLLDPDENDGKATLTVYNDLDEKVCINEPY